MIEIKLKGTGLNIASIEYCLNEDGELDDCGGDMCEFGMILKDVLVEADGVDITKMKGKYVKSKEWIKDRYCVDDEPPHVFRVVDDEFEFTTVFQLDVDDFDPSKLQLIKSDYETSFLPYGIVMDTILYDGEEVMCVRDDDFDDNFQYYMTDYSVYKEEVMPYA